jgi:hypothetical protein
MQKKWGNHGSNLQAMAKESAAKTSFKGLQVAGRRSMYSMLQLSEATSKKTNDMARAGARCQFLLGQHFLTSMESATREKNTAHATRQQPVSRRIDHIV